MSDDKKSRPPIRLCPQAPVKTPEKEVEKGSKSAQKPPFFLKKEAKKEWNRLIEDMNGHGSYDSLDHNTLAQYCVTWGLFVKTAEEVTEFGLLEVVNGNEQLSQTFNAFNRLQKQLTMLGDRLGLSPRARKMIGVEPVVKEDDFDKISRQA